MAKSKLKRGQKIRWTSKGPMGKKRREGIVRGFVPAGAEIKFPKTADMNKFKAEQVNKIHNRYLVEIPRVHKRTGKKLASQWLAPKAAILDKTAKVQD
jgi:hypothetical protein